MQSHVLKWNNPGTHTDGSPHTQNENAGYSVIVDQLPAQSLDLQYGTSFDVTTLIDKLALKPGTHTISIAAVGKTGVVGMYSVPSSFTVSPQPAAPSNVSIT